LAATNSTVTANDATGGENLASPTGGTGGQGNGGGICITGGSATLINLTIASNRADGGTNGANGLPTGMAQGGALFTTNSTVTLRNSILANSANGFDVWGAVIDAGYNLCSDGTAGFSGPGSLNHVDPLLSALSQNGGPTPTMALLAGSPARDAIPSGFPPTDQRGVTRPQGPAADIGAFEADFISAAAAILVQPKAATVRAGTNYTFVVVASGTAPLSYAWRKDGNVLAGASASTLSLANVQANDAGTYSVVVTNAFGIATSLGAALVVDSTPLLLAQPTPVIVSPGMKTNFQVLADGPQLGYQWWHNGLAIPWGTSSTLTISNAVAGSQGGYFAVISNFAGTVTSATATLSFDSSALSILVSQKDTNVEAGFTASLTVVASGIPPLVYQWDHNGAAIPGATGSSLTLTNVGTKDAGSYHVVVTNGYSQVTSSDAQLVVTPGAIPVQLTAKGQGSSIIIDFQAEAGRQYRLLTSTDLRVWSPVATNTAVLAGPLELVQPVTRSNVFYRVVTP
jgi:hypothetical protein